MKHVMATVQSQVVGACESSVLFVVTGLIAEMLFTALRLQ